MVVICNSLYITVNTKYCSNGLRKCPPNSECQGREGCHCLDGYEFVGLNCLKGKDDELLRYLNASEMNCLFCWSISNLTKRELDDIAYTFMAAY